MAYATDVCTISDSDSSHHARDFPENPTSVELSEHWSAIQWSRKGKTSLHLAKVPDKEKCELCNTTETSYRRTGPGGEKTLCDACGIRWEEISEGSARENTPKSSEVLRNISGLANITIASAPAPSRWRSTSQALSKHAVNGDDGPTAAFGWNMETDWNSECVMAVDEEDELRTATTAQAANVNLPGPDPCNVIEVLERSGSHQHLSVFECAPSRIESIRLAFDKQTPFIALGTEGNATESIASEDVSQEAVLRSTFTTGKATSVQHRDLSVSGKSRMPGEFIFMSIL